MKNIKEHLKGIYKSYHESGDVTINLTLSEIYQKIDALSEDDANDILKRLLNYIDEDTKR